MLWLSCLFRAFALFLYLATMASAYAQDASDYEKQLSELNATIEALKKELATTKSAQAGLEQALQLSEEEISQLQRQIDKTKEALDREKKQLARYQGQQIELEASRQTQQQQINRSIHQAYQMGQQSQIKLLLNQEEPYRVSRMLRYHDYILAARKQKMDAYRATLRELEKLQQQITVSSERLARNQTQLQQRFTSLKDKQAERIATLAKLTDQLSSRGQDLNRAEQSQQRLERLLREATQTLSALQLPSDTRPFASIKGKLPYPTTGPVRHSFGSPKVDDKLFWKGLFIAGNEGSDVVSVHYGRVIFSDYLRGQGLLLIIDHGDGFMSLYAHNQILLKETGDWVSSGEKIAMVGNTGGLQRSGLYFEIRHRGRPLDPTPWLARKRG